MRKENFDLRGTGCGRALRADRDSTVTYDSGKPSGPTAGSETMDALEFLARVASHIADKGQVLQRYYGWYASWPRDMRRKTAGGDEEPPKELTCVRVDPGPEALRDARTLSPSRVTSGPIPSPGSRPMVWDFTSIPASVGSSGRSPSDFGERP